MKNRDHATDLSALITAYIGFYPCQRFILWLRHEAALWCERPAWRISAELSHDKQMFWIFYQRDDRINSTNRPGEEALHAKAVREY